ncbi:hypothetical protein MPH47_19625 [Psychrobacillus psychrodurans]|nr:hypothetical protein [Psychrobacillus psychrodurans]MCK1999408.1 hypothetical protein [Psychrobacillus psychrodurans]
MPKKKSWENELEESKETADHEQTIANLIILSLITIVGYKIMTGTF